MDTPSIHDATVVGYDVDSESRRIVLRTRTESGDRVDVVFEGVLGYLLLDAPLAGSILLDIEEVSFDDFLDEHAALFEKERRFYWPFGGGDDPKALAASRNARTFFVQPSIGLSGYVVCSSMTVGPPTE